MIFYPVTPHGSVSIRFPSFATRPLPSEFGFDGVSLLALRRGSRVIRSQGPILVQFSTFSEALRHHAKANERGRYGAALGPSVSFPFIPMQHFLEQKSTSHAKISADVTKLDAFLVYGETDV